MSLRPTSLIIDRESPTGMYVVIDDPESSGPLLIPCSWDHRRVDISREEIHSGRFEFHRARAGGERVVHRRLAEQSATIAYIATVIASFLVAILGPYRLLRFIKRIIRCRR